MATTRIRIRILLPLLACMAIPCRAQVIVSDHEDLAFDRPEAWAMAYAAAATLFLGSTVPRGAEPGSISLGASLAGIPHIDREDTRVGFNGQKLEDLNKSPVFGRVRIGIGLPWRFTAELAWTPPVEIDGARPDGIFALALSRPLVQTDSWRVGARLFAQSGHIEGDITCSEEIAGFPLGSPQNPRGCRAPSRDDVELDYYGLELGAAWRVNDMFEPFAAIAVTRLDAFVQVNARVFSVIDRSTRATEGTMTTFRAGAAFHPAPSWQFTIAGDYTPLEVRRPSAFEEETDPFWSIRLYAQYTF